MFVCIRVAVMPRSLSWSSFSVASIVIVVAIVSSIVTRIAIIIVTRIAIIIPIVAVQLS